MTLHNHRRTGFTLVELMAVIAIMGIIAALLVAAATGARRNTMATRARADVKLIVSKIEAYRNKRGEMPVNKAGLTTEAYLYNLLDQWGFTVPVKQQVDPWGHPYVVVFQADYGKTFPIGSRPANSGYDDNTKPTWRVGSAYSPWDPNPAAWVDQAKEVHTGDLSTEAFMIQAEGYQVLSAGPDGKIAQRSDIEPFVTCNADNITNWQE